MSDRLPVLLSPDGEAVELFTAGDLLRSRGIEDLEKAETVDVARFMDDLKHVKSLIAEAEQAASDELVGRLDASASWTRHEGEFTIKAPSPSAGTEAYDTAMLDDALCDLVAEGTIDLKAASAALEVVHPKPFFKQHARGIAALLKLPAAREAIEACKTTVDPPARKVKVTRA